MQACRDGDLFNVKEALKEGSEFSSRYGSTKSTQLGSFAGMALMYERWPVVLEIVKHLDTERMIECADFLGDTSESIVTKFICLMEERLEKEGFSTFLARAIKALSNEGKKVLACKLYEDFQDLRFRHQGGSWLMYRKHHPDTPLPLSAQEGLSILTTVGMQTSVLNEAARNFIAHLDKDMSETTLGKEEILTFWCAIAKTNMGEHFHRVKAYVSKLELEQETSGTHTSNSRLSKKI